MTVARNHQPDVDKPHLDNPMSLLGLTLSNGWCRVFRPGIGIVMQIVPALALPTFASEPVMSLIAAKWRLLRTQVLEHKVELRLALRMTISVASSLLLSQLLHLPMPLWTMLTSIILTQVSFGRSLKATIDYLIGTLFGAVYGGAVVSVIPHTSEIAMVAVLAMVVAPLALLGAVNPRFTTATFTGVMMLMVPSMTHTSALESAIFRVLEVAVGGITALVVSFLVLPARAYALAIEAAAQMLDLAARSLSDLFAGFAEPRDGAEMARIHDNLGTAWTRLNTVTAEAKIEQIRFLEAAPEMGPLRRTLLRLRHDLVMVGRAAAVPLPDAIRKRLGAPLARVAETAADYLRRSGEALAARRGPAPLSAAEAALDGCANAFAVIRQEGLTLGLPVDTVERVFALGFALEQLRRNFHDLERCVKEASRRR
jgi:uncharacterized membrane protein YccC